MSERQPNSSASTMTMKAGIAATAPTSSTSQTPTPMTKPVAATSAKMAALMPVPAGQDGERRSQNRDDVAERHEEEEAEEVGHGASG